MMIVTVKRSNTALPGLKKCFHNPDHAADWIQLHSESIKEDGWELEQDEKSDELNGMITGVNPYEVYELIITWRTLNG